MNKKALSVLEYDKIIELLKEKAGSDLTREKISELCPYTEAYIISEELRLATEGVSLIMHKGEMPVGGIYDVVPFLKRACKGGSLTAGQLLKVQYDLDAASAAAGFMNDSDLPELPGIEGYTELLSTIPELSREIERCILSEDDISDNASTELKNIRRKMNAKNAAVRNRLDRMISSSAYRVYLQDAIVTMRDGRYVIPVKQEYRSRISGLVHDQSKGGATVFIEPQAVVELNNELRELELAEEREIARILAELSSRVAEHRYEIENNQKILIELDFINAKAKFSIDMEGVAPSVNEGGILKISKGKHPLLDQKKAIPLDLVLGDGYRTLIVTGPNTGGKTVALKTAGLLVMMVQSGLHIPASSLSTVPVYDDVFADIGDEQSIEQSLSTFSSHMKNIVEIMDEAGPGSLVLLDELGAGTDPTEGAALAISILEDLYKKGSSVMATTHYNELKKYALSTEGVMNGSMEFNVDTLSPTYRLLTGVPGKSNAFEISGKLGLEKSVIERARNLIEGGDIEFENVVSAIEDDRRKAEVARDEAEKIHEDIRSKEKELDRQLEDLDRMKEQLMKEAREEARAVLRDARETANEVQKELKDLAREENRGTRNHRFDQARKKLKKGEDRYAEKVIKRVNNNPVKASQLKVGDRVKVLTLGQNGKILTLPNDKGEVSVQVGIMKANVDISDLMLIEEGKKKKKKNSGRTDYGGVYRRKTKTVSPSVNVQGKNLMEAEDQVMKYLDDAFVAGLEQVTIIHGRGTGVLKDGLRKMLKNHKQVASFKAGKYNEGGEGVTIVKMKK